jgi:hypothetical protein
VDDADCSVPFVPSISNLNLRAYGADDGKAHPAFSVLYSGRVTLTNHYWVTSDERLRASRETDVRARRPRLPDWCLGGFCISYSLALNWLFSYSWFSPRYAFFSGPVLREMGLIVALNAAIAFFGAYLIGGNWRTAMGFFVLASYVLIRLMH